MQYETQADHHQLHVLFSKLRMQYETLKNFVVFISKLSKLRMQYETMKCLHFNIVAFSKLRMQYETSFSFFKDSCQFQFTKRQFYKISITYIQYYKELCDKFTNQCCDKPNNLHSTMRQNL